MSQVFTLAEQSAAVARALRDDAFANDDALAAAGRTLRLIAGHADGLRDLLGFLRIHGGIDPDTDHADRLLALPGVREVVAQFPDAILSSNPLGAASAEPEPENAAS